MHLCTYIPVSAVLNAIERPKRAKSSLFRVSDLGRWETSWNLQLDDPSLQTDHRRLGSVVGAQLGKNVLDSPLDRLLGDRQLIRNLLIGISGCDQPQHVDLCGREGIVGCMLGDFE